MRRLRQPIRRCVRRQRDWVSSVSGHSSPLVVVRLLRPGVVRVLAATTALCSLRQTSLRAARPLVNTMPARVCVE